MVKIVYNSCYGGFSLSPEAVRLGKSLSSSKEWQEVIEEYGYFDGPRHDETLVKVVEDLGDRSNGAVARLRIHVLPDGSEYRIDEYDGNESVETRDSYDWVRT